MARHWALLVALVLYASLVLPRLANFPPVNVDDAYQTAPAHSLMTRGKWESAPLGDPSGKWRESHAYDGAEFGRTQLSVPGLICCHLQFKVEYDFAGGETEFKSVYWVLNGLPVVGNVRVGHSNEPFGLEEQTSSKYISFMERGPARLRQNNRQDLGQC